MKALVPLAVTDAVLFSSSVPEADFPWWVPGTAYAVGDRVIHITTHCIYERLIAGTTSTAPEDAPDHWVRVGPTNRWALLDESPGSATSVVVGPLVYEFDMPGAVSDIALIGLLATQVQVHAGGTLVRTVAVPAPVAPSTTSTVVISGLSVAQGVRLKLTISGTGAVSVAHFTAGAFSDLGRTLPGAQVGITDYSTKTTDDFGVTAVKRRPYSRKLQATVVVPVASVDAVSSVLEDLRAVVCFWQFVDGFESLSTLGFYRDWGFDLREASQSTYSITVEGLARDDVVISPGQPLTLTGAEALVESGNYEVQIESTNGDEFRVGLGTHTLLIAHVFRNGVEVTADVPESWFRWRRVSLFPAGPPNDDASWNALYATGYKQINVSVDDVASKATFFCDILKP